MSSVRLRLAPQHGLLIMYPKMKVGGKIAPSYLPSLNGYSYDFGRKFAMPAAERRMCLLRHAAGWREEFVRGWSGEKEWVQTSRRGIAIHCEGGIALKDRDLKMLLAKGLLKTSRSTGSTGLWSDGRYNIRTSFAELTPAGWAVVGQPAN